MFLEIELKLAIASDEADRLYNNPFLASYSKGPKTPQNLVSTYYDTPNQCLWQHGLSLRLREDSSRFAQTLKTAGQQVGSLHHRHEWDQVIPSALPDIELFSDKELRAKLARLIGTQPLTPLFKTEFVRTQWDIRLAEDTHIELVLDQGTVNNTSQSHHLHEIELELRQGEADKLYVVADILRQSMTLTVENRSKAQRGYLLCTQS